jgi:hypothetical protein
MDPSIAPPALLLGVPIGVRLYIDPRQRCVVGVRSPLARRLPAVDHAAIRTPAFSRWSCWRAAGSGRGRLIAVRSWVRDLVEEAFAPLLSLRKAECLAALELPRKHHVKRPCLGPARVLSYDRADLYKHVISVLHGRPFR